MSIINKAIFILPSLKDFSPINGIINLAISINDILPCMIVGMDKEFSINIVEKIQRHNMEYLILDCNGFKNILKAKKKLQKILTKKTILFSSMLRPDLTSNILKKLSALRISFARDFVDRQYLYDYNYFISKVVGLVHFHALRNMDYVIVLSNSMKEYFIKKGIKINQIKVVNNFIDELEITKKKSEIIFDIKEEKIAKFITCSRVIKRKNIDFLIKGFEKIRDEGLNFRFYILGDGEEIDHIKSLINYKNLQENIILIGYKDNPVPYIDRCDFYVSASIAEGISRSVMEALFLGKACILSDIDGHRELVIEGKNGKLFKDLDEFVSIIRKVILRKINFNNSEKNLLPEQYSLNYNKECFRGFVLDILENIQVK